MNVKWLYYSNYYDGPISGAVEIEGKMFYAYLTYQNDNLFSDWSRKYSIIDLPPEIWELELEKQNLFRESCGSHFDFRDLPKTEYATDCSSFYMKYPPDVNLFDCESYHTIGTFCE